MIHAKKIENSTEVITITPSNKLSDIQELLLKQNELKQTLHKSGALLFRNFNINCAEKFKEFAEIFANDLMSDNGEHDSLPAIQGIYTPVSYSPKEKLLWHNENSFNYSWPLVIMFCCVKPANIGGETPVVDSRKVLKNLDPAIVKEFSRKGIMYVRTYGFGRAWQEIYQTNSRAEMELKCQQQNIQIEWLNDDQLITTQIRPAIVKHPLSDEYSWFNQVQHWHAACLKPEVRESLLKMFSPDRLPRNCYFGDGSIISEDIVQHILDVYQNLEVSFSWEAGDVMVLDNVLFAHARNAYSGERKLLVTMGRYSNFAST